ncbi:hypothetical protein V8E55_005015 [Tylopilus felleus]
MKDAKAVKRLASQNLKGIRPTIKMSANLKEEVTSAVIPKASSKEVANDLSVASSSASSGLEQHVNSTSPQPKKPSNGLGLRDLLTAAQIRCLRTKQIVNAAAKVHGLPQPQTDSIIFRTMMLMLTESTLFFVNMMCSSSSTHPNNKAKLLANSTWSCRYTHLPSPRRHLPVVLHQPSYTYHGNFGEDDDDTQEQEAARWAGKNQVVRPCRAHSSPTSIEGRTNLLETKRS